MTRNFLDSFEFGETKGREEYERILLEGTENISPEKVMDSPVADIATFAVVRAMAREGLSSSINVTFAFAGLINRLDNEVINPTAVGTYPVFEE